MEVLAFLDSTARFVIVCPLHGRSSDLFVPDVSLDDIKSFARAVQRSTAAFALLNTLLLGGGLVKSWTNCRRLHIRLKDVKDVLTSDGMSALRQPHSSWLPCLASA